MIDTHRSLMVIPARGGSKRLTRKNVIELAGKPLIAHTIEAAIAAQCFSQIMVSTDDNEIKAVAKDYPEVLIDDRSSILAGDQTKVVDVIYEICTRSKIKSNFNIIGMMLPTAPFRRISKIQEGLNCLSPDIDAVVSFTPYEFPPQMAVTLEGDNKTMRPIYEPSPLINGNTRSQDQTPSYRPNGSIFLSWIPAFLRLRSFYKGRVRGIEMTPLGSVDIDEEEDMKLAQTLIQAGLAESDFT